MIENLTRLAVLAKCVARHWISDNVTTAGASVAFFCSFNCAAVGDCLDHVRVDRNLAHRSLQLLKNWEPLRRRGHERLCFIGLHGFF